MIEKATSLSSCVCLSRALTGYIVPHISHAPVIQASSALIAGREVEDMISCWASSQCLTVTKD